MTNGIDSLIINNASFSYRPIIVWAMNDKLVKQEMKIQLADFKSCGYGGVMVMPWGGLPYDFMAAEWIEAVDCILECASELDMDIWIWDDWCYGSGFAGGVLAKENPEFRASSLKIILDVFIETGETFEFILPPRAISASVFDIDKFGNPIGEKFEAIDIEANKKITLHAEQRQRIVIVGWEYISGMHHTTKSHGSFMDNSLSNEQIGVRIWEDREAWGVDHLNPAATREYLRLIHQRYYDRSAKYFGNTMKGFFFDEPKMPTSRPWTHDFAERFKESKGYDILKYLPSILLDYKMDNANFNSYFRPECVKKAEADYSDAWTTFMAESFYYPIGDWCKSHQVLSGGHPIGDGSGAEHKELFSCGGVYCKNMAQSEFPGIDTVWGTIVPGKFVDNPRFAASIAVSNGLNRALSESFAVWGHGTDIDSMRYTCEHQIIRGVNTFFCKLSNYNREKSLLFHSPELSGFNPIIKHYGSAFCDRIDLVARLMNSGKTVSRAAVYIEMENYYHGDTALAEFLGKIAEKLTYEQVEYDYVYASDIFGFKYDGSTIQNRHGQIYHSIIVPAESMMSSEVRSALAELGNRVHHVNKSNLDLVVADLKYKGDLPYVVVSSGSRISSLSRILGNEVQCSMFLNESDKPETLSLCFSGMTTLGEFEPNNGTIEAMGTIVANGRLEIKLVVGESQILIFYKLNRNKDLGKQHFVTGKEQVISNWTLHTPDGKMLKLNALSDWTTLGFAGYTGFMRYSTEFEWTNTGDAVLALGELCYAATVFLDGRKIQDCLFQPLKIKLGNLSKGTHLLEIDVLNTMANSIFGDEKKLKALRNSGAFNGTYAEFYEQRDMEKLKSGLLGPTLIYRNNNEY
jgi:hypothetical protein